MSAEESVDEPHEALNALVGVDRLVDVALLDLLKRCRRNVGVKDEDLFLRCKNGGNRSFGRAGFRDPESPKLRVACNIADTA